MRQDRRVDDSTIDAYDSAPAQYADEWESQPAPADMYALLREHFAAGATADVGCGSGRDTAWLAAAGYDPIGYDASAGLLAVARDRHPGVRFERAALPDLAGVPSGTFANVLCETVIMHLPSADVRAATGRLVGLLAPRGVLYLSWRVTADEDRRDDAGRLYAAFDASLVRAALGGGAGVEILHDQRSTSESSGRVVHRIIARRRG
jgi:SAM-dependent methyltransferase